MLHMLTLELLLLPITDIKGPATSALMHKRASPMMCVHMAHMHEIPPVLHPVVLLSCCVEFLCLFCGAPVPVLRFSCARSVEFLCLSLGKPVLTLRPFSGAPGVS